VQTWIEEINAGCLDKLQTLHHDFKYIVNTVVVQKVGAGVHASAACYWEQATDGNLTFRWENPWMTILVHVYALAL
jgi:dynein light chain Tctex-type 1